MERRCEKDVYFTLEESALITVVLPGDQNHEMRDGVIARGSGIMKTRHGWLQGYNAKVVVIMGQII